MPLPSKDGQKSRVPSPKDFFPPPSSWGQRWESENTRAAWSPVFSLGGGPPRRFWPTLDLAEQYINLTVSSKTDFRICWCSTAKSTLTNKSYISSVCVCVISRFSHVQLFATLWPAHQAPLSVGFSRQEYWSGLPCPSSRDLPDTGIEPGIS